MAFECPESFFGMSGSGTVRTCAACDRPVTNLSALSHAEARRAIAAGGCVAFERSEDGELLFSSPRRSLRVIQPLALAAALAACTAPAERSTADAANAAASSEDATHAESTDETPLPTAPSPPPTVPSAPATTRALQVDEADAAAPHPPGAQRAAPRKKPAHAPRRPRDGWTAGIIAIDL